MKKLLLPFAAAAAVCGWIAAADAASVTVTVTVSPPASTSVTFTPADGPLVAPVAAGTVVGTVSVAPSTWTSPPGVLTPGGTNGSDFVIVGNQVEVAPGVTLIAGSYQFSITATP